MWRILTSLSVLLFSSSCFEGDSSGWYIECGRFEGEWRVEDASDLVTLREWCPLGEMESIAFVIDSLPEDVVNREQPFSGLRELTGEETGNPRGSGRMIVRGRSFSFELWPWGIEDSTALCNDNLLRFEEALPFLTDGSFRDVISLFFVAGRNPDSDELHLFLGEEPEGRATAVQFHRVSGPSARLMKLSVFAERRR